MPTPSPELSPLAGKLLIIGLAAAALSLILICGRKGEEAPAEVSVERSPAATPAPVVEAAPDPEPERPKPEPVIAIKASALWAAYEANEVKADDTFKDKKLEVSGKIETIGKDILGDPYITLGTGQEFSIGGVQAVFDRDASKQLAALNKGQAVKVRCVCDGRLGNVLLKDCTLR
jgi:3-oxoacyl-ACP reductase-like protein